MSKSKRIEAEYQNEYGLYVPGDNVIVVTVCTGHVNVHRGKYLGYTESTGLRGSTIKRVQVAVPSERTVWFYKGTDKKFNWSDTEARQNKQYESRTVYVDRVATLQHNRIFPVTLAKDMENI